MSSRTTSAALLAASLAAVLTAVPARAEEKGKAGEKPAAPTGVAAFSNHARFVDAKISPKGTWLALVAEEGGRRWLVFFNLAERRYGSRPNPGGDSTVLGYHWVNEERVVVEMGVQDGVLARPSFYGDLLAVNPTTGESKLIFGFRSRANPQLGWAHVVDTLRDDDQHVLVGIMNMRDVGDRAVRLAKLDVDSGSTRDVAWSPVPNADISTDEAGNPRIACSTDEKAKRQCFFRDDDRSWRRFDTLPGVTGESLPWGFATRDRTLKVVEPVAGGWGLFAVGVDSGERKLLGRTTLAPPDRTLVDQVTGKPLAIESEPDLPDWQLLDPKHPLVQVLDGLLEAHPGQHVRLISRTRDDRLAVAHVYGDRNPGQFLLVDVARRTAEPVAEARPWIKPEAMAETSGFHIKASDGLLIHGYVTYPRGLPDGARAPLVVLPHGGPFGVRDHWRFDPEVQLLASEGFAVLQVNYRGSGGYGLAYKEAGYRHWGDRIIEDILDATRWLVKKGKVDGGRICTYGTSFGGYAALQATIVAPELFRCAAGNAGAYDLKLLETSDAWVTSSRARGFVRTTLGDDEAALEAASPIHHADRIKVPVLLIHGAKDKVVGIEHAEKLRDALTKLGRPPEWLVEPIEGHGFYDERARERMYTRLVAFLKANTGPVATVGPAAPATGATGSGAPAPASSVP